jgi:hypothetical protein
VPTAQELDTLAKFDAVFKVADRVPSGAGANRAALDAVETLIRSTWGIQRDATGAVSGPALHLQGQTTGLDLFVYGSTSTVSGAMLTLADAYAACTPEQLPRISALYVDLCEHVLGDMARQGKSTFAYLASSLYDWPSVSRRAVFGMRGVLEPAGLWLPVIRSIPSWTNPAWLIEGYGLDNSDDWRIAVWYEIFHSVAALPMGPEKWQRFRVAERFFNRQLDQDLEGTALPVSGEFAHHSNLNMDYAYALGPLWTDVKKMLAGGMTLLPGARERMRACARMTSWIGLAGGYYPSNLNLRPAPTHRFGGTLPLDGLADLGTPDGSAAIDPQMAGFYLAVNPTGAAASRYTAAGITAQSMTGVMALPYRPGMVWRNGDDLVGVAGLVSGIRYGYEDYGGDRQSLYVCAGTIQVMRKGTGASQLRGFAEPGWDWCMFPGATSLMEAASDVVLSNWRGRGGSLVGGVCVLGNTDPMGGATGNLQVGDDAAGLFCIDYRGNSSNRVTRAWFRRSVFAVGNQFLVVTTDIQRGNATGIVGTPPPVTTLYQSSLASTATVSWVDGTPETGTDGVRSLGMDVEHTLVDPDGIQYIALPLAGGNVATTLKVARRSQSWWLARTNTTNSGNFALAWFEYPANSGSVGVNAYVMRPRDASTYAGVSRPQVLVATAAAHVVFDPDSATYGYAAFASNLAWNDGPLLATGLYGSFLVREISASRLRVAAQAWDYVSASGTLRMVLRGVWSLAQPSAIATATNDGANTTVTITRAPIAVQMPVSLELIR